MSLRDRETLQTLLARYLRESLTELSPEQAEEMARRFEELIRVSGDASQPTGFVDLVGLGGNGPLGFDSDEIGWPRIEPDFESAALPSQLHAAAELYYIYQHERMKVFQVAGVLVRLFHEGRMRMQTGPGARAIYLLEKHFPLRYKQHDRMLAYRRVFNYGSIAPSANAVVYRDFHRQFVAFNAALAQYFRDLLIGEVIRGSQLIEQRPFGSQATIQRLGADLRWRLDRATYGFIMPLTVETGQYLKVILDMLETPDVKKAWDANTKWDVVEFVSQRHLGGVGEISQRIRMADAGRRLLEFVATPDPFTIRDFNQFQVLVRPLGSVAEEWIAAYRMVPEGRSFPGVTPAFRSMLRTSSLPRQATA